MNRQYPEKKDGDSGPPGPIPSPGYPTPTSGYKAASEERPHFNVPFPTMPVMPTLDPTVGSSFYGSEDPYFNDAFDY